MALFKMPLLSVPQRFSIELGGVLYYVANRWNNMDGGGWFLDLYDADEKPLVMNLPLVTGTDLFKQFAHLSLPGELIVFTDGQEGALPTLENLGEESNVWLVTSS